LIISGEVVGVLNKEEFDKIVASLAEEAL